MNSYSHLFEKLIDKEGIKQDILDASKGKRDRWCVIKYTGDLSENDSNKTINKTIDKIHDMYVNGFELKPGKKSEIYDGIKRKKRTIVKPRFFPDQIMHHGIVRVMTENLKLNENNKTIPNTGIMTIGMYECSCGCIPGRGPHYGKKMIEKWINVNPGDVKYVGKCDIKKFFDSVSIRRLKKFFKKKIKDKRFLKIVFKFLNLFKTGLILGFYISHWFANFLLEPLDHYIKQEILKDIAKEKQERHIAKIKRKGIEMKEIPDYKNGALYFVRYVDDIVIFGKVKKEIHLVIKRIREYLVSEFALKMKNDWQVFRFYFADRIGKVKGRVLDYMGFIFSRISTNLRKSILFKTVRKVNKIKKKGKITWHDASSLLSYLGWFKHTATYGVYLKYIKPFIKVKTLKKLVSKHNIKERIKLNEKLAKRNMQFASC